MRQELTLQNNKFFFHKTEKKKQFFKSQVKKMRTFLK